MILTEYDTLLSLEEFRQIVRMHPYHFWQLADDELVPHDQSCDDLLFEEDWMASDAISRRSIIEGIRQAEQKISDYLLYDPLPRYRTYTAQWPRFLEETLYRSYNVDGIGRAISVRVPYGQVQAVGSISQTLIGNATVTLIERPTGSGLNYSFTATIATTVTDPDRLAVYFASADRWDASQPLAYWRIRPVQISISGGIATIRGNAWQIVIPEEYANPVTGNTQGGIGLIDPTDASVFVSELAVYDEYITSNGQTVDDAQATLIWETRPYPYWCFNSTGPIYDPNAADPAAVGKAIARVGIRNATMGILTPGAATFDATAGEWRTVIFPTGYEPDRVEIRYLAGLPPIDAQMDRYWKETIAWMALAELEGPICACESVRKRLHHWQFDLARTSGADDEAYGAISQADLSNPFGTRRGQVEAWHRVSSRRTHVGIAL